MKRNIEKDILRLLIVKHKVYEKYSKEIEMLHTPEGKKPDSENNLKSLQNLLKV